MVQGTSHWHCYAPRTRQNLRDFRTAPDYWDEVPLCEALGFHVEFNGFNGVLEFLLWILGCIFVVYSRHGSPLLGDGVQFRRDSGFVRVITMPPAGLLKTEPFVRFQSVPITCGIVTLPPGERTWSYYSYRRTGFGDRKSQGSQNRKSKTSMVLTAGKRAALIQRCITRWCRLMSSSSETDYVVRMVYSLGGALGDQLAVLARAGTRFHLRCDPRFGLLVDDGVNQASPDSANPSSW